MGQNVARAAVDVCLQAGIREFVICAGARNVEIVAQLAATEGVRCHHHPEERSAAFFALGRIMRTGCPVAVVTTSGTAVAELLPATIEAFYQARPLVLLTADRPQRFRGSGAPQAIDQVGLFGGYACEDIGDWCRDRPLHLNVCLEEPSVAAVGAVVGGVVGAVVGAPEIVPEPPGGAGGAEELANFLQRDGDLFVMVGCLPEERRPAVREFLLRLAAPVYLEATSGLREDLAALPRADSGGRVLRIGGVPSCRFWRDLEDLDLEVFSVASNGLPGLARDSQVVTEVDWQRVPAGAPSPQRAAAADVTPLLERYPNSEAAWFRRLSEAVPEGALVFLGNSLPVREWNLAASYRDRGLRCFANRGANGIDGSVSTFFGLAVDEAEAWLICGDLTAIYDLAAPWMLAQMRASNLRIVVINNGGGRIFDRLPAMAAASEDVGQMVRNPHALRFDGWAAMWGMSYRRVEKAAQLADLPTGAVVVEVLPDLASSDAFWDEWGSR